jgi:hypothetical protein
MTAVLETSTLFRVQFRSSVMFCCCYLGILWCCEEISPYDNQHTSNGPPLKIAVEEEVFIIGGRVLEFISPIINLNAR